MKKPKSLRICHVTTSHFADDVRIYERECKSLSSHQNWSVYLIGGGGNCDEAGISVLDIGSPPRSRLIRFLVRPLRALLKVRRQQFDILHFHDPELLPTAFLFAKLGRLVIWDAHEDYRSQFSEEGSKSWIPRPLRQIVSRGTSGMLTLIDRNATAVVAATPTIASTYTNPRTVVVGNEAKVSQFQTCSPMFGERRVLFTGSLGSGQLFLEVVRAVSQIDDVELWVAGRSPDESVWTEAKSILGDRITYIGWLNRSKLIETINNCSIGLLTYADLPTNASNRPNKLYEYAAAGLPVVATPTASNRAYLLDSGCGVLTNGFTSHAIAQGILQLLSDSELWKEASNAARAWSLTSGSWDVSEQRLIELYNTIFEEQR